MKKSKFIKSTIILLIGGFLTKLLGMIIKIITTRLLGTEGIGIYSLLMPTFGLLIAVAQLGFPVAISKLVAEETKNNKTKKPIKKNKPQKSKNHKKKSKKKKKWQKKFY